MAAEVPGDPHRGSGEDRKGVAAKVAVVTAAAAAAPAVTPAATAGLEVMTAARSAEAMVGPKEAAAVIPAEGEGG